MQIKYSNFQMGHQLILVFACLWVLAFAPTLGSITTEWQGVGPYSHGYLALLIAVYCFWNKRSLLGVLDIRFKPSAAMVIVLLGLIWWAAEIANVLSVQQLVVLALLDVALLYLYGWNVFRQLQFPMLVMLFALPMWDFLQGPLRDLSTYVSFHAVKLLGIPVLLEGYTVTVPGGLFLIEKACAGLSFLLTALTLGIVFGSVNHMSYMSTAIYTSSAVLLSLIANWIRIISIILVGNFTNMQSIIVKDHLTFGWVLFAVIFFPLIIFGNRLFPYRKSATVENHNTPGQRDSSSSISVSKTQLVGYYGAVLSLTLLFPTLNMLLEGRGAEGNYDYRPPNTDSVLNRVESSNITFQWKPKFSGANSEYFASYDYLGERALLYIVNYRKEAQGAELINKLNVLYDKKRWVSIREELVANDQQEGQFQLILLKGPDGKKRVIVYWYSIGGHITAQPIVAKAYQVWVEMMGRRGSSLVAVAIDYDGLEEHRVLSTIKSFISEVKKAI